MREFHLLGRTLTCSAVHTGIGTTMVALAIVLTHSASCRSLDWDDGRHSQDRLEAIAAAICDHRDYMHVFPPPAIFDAEGQPLHSWRVLIVPFLRKNWFADTYCWDEPWNGPHNSQLLKTHYEGSGDNRHDVSGVRACFVCENPRRAAPNYTTCFLLLVDKKRPCEVTKYRRSDCDAKGWQQNKAIGGAMIVVEVSGSAIHWMDPRDITLDEVAAVLAKNSSTYTEIQGVAIISADCSVRILNKDVARERLQDMVTDSKDKNAETGTGTIPPGE